VIVAAFFALTYLVSWTCFAAGGWLARDTGGIGFDAGVLLLAGTIAPSLVAIAMTAAREGRERALTLLERAVQADVALRWYVFAIAFFPLVKLTVAVVYRLGYGAWPRFGTESWYIIPIAIVFSTPVQAGEEIGWRGFALPRLAARIGFGPASIIVGAVWGVWHLPLFYIGGVEQYRQSLPMFAAGTTALSVAMAWLYVKTGGSVLLTMVMHSAVNQTVGIVPSAAPVTGSPFSVHGSAVGWLTDGVLWIAAIGFLIAMRGVTPATLAALPRTGVHREAGEINL
jgi:membrane protease YdiL (CAAX protease family)